MARKLVFSFHPPEGVYLLHEPSKQPPCVTTRDHGFYSEVTAVTVPAGFRYDMASIPSWLLWMFPPLGRHQRAALFHDYLYQSQITTRSTADGVFREILEHDQVGWWRRWFMYVGVRLFGWLAWRRHKPNAAKFYCQMSDLREGET